MFCSPISLQSCFSFRPRIRLTVGVWPVFVAVVKLEIHGVKSCQILPYVYCTACVFYVMPRGQRTFMGITARTSKNSTGICIWSRGSPKDLISTLNSFLTEVELCTFLTHDCHICNPLWQKKQMHKVMTQLPVFLFWGGLVSGTISAFIHCLIEDCFFLPGPQYFSLSRQNLPIPQSSPRAIVATFSLGAWHCVHNTVKCVLLLRVHVYKHLAWCCWQCFAQSFNSSSPIILWRLLLTSIRRLWCSSVPLYVSEMNDLSSFSVPFVVECHFCCRMKDIVSNNYNTTAIQSFSL